LKVQYDLNCVESVTKLQPTNLWPFPASSAIKL